MENLNKKITILEFEFNHLVDMLINGNQERWLPGYSAPDTNIAHLNRYHWVSDYVTNKKVLDLACGTGFGSLYLTNEGKATHVIAGDCNEKAIEYCEAKHNKQPNLTFKRIDAENFTLSEKMDVIVSFETIEHLKNPKLFLQNCSKYLNENGIFFVSTPVSMLPIDTKPVNKHHLIEWNITEFAKIMQSFFTIESFFIQPYHKFNPHSLTIYKKIISKINKNLYKTDLNFIDYKIIDTKNNLIDWQKLVNLNLIGAYVVMQCKKKN